MLVRSHARGDRTSNRCILKSVQWRDGMVFSSLYCPVVGRTALLVRYRQHFPPSDVIQVFWQAVGFRFYGSRPSWGLEISLSNSNYPRSTHTPFGTPHERGLTLAATIDPQANKVCPGSRHVP